MKALKFLSVLFLLFSAILISSCENEPIDSALLDAIDNGGGGVDGGGGKGGGGTDGGGSTGGSTTGDYWPTAINNEWVFQSGGIDQDPMKIKSMNVINNKTYYTFDSLFGQTIDDSDGQVAATVRIHKSSGVYTIKFEDLIIDLQGFKAKQSGYEFIILKDNLSVGQKWTGSYTQTTTYDGGGIPEVKLITNYTGTVLEKGATLVVNEKSFSNVIHVSLKMSTSYFGINSEIDSDYWFAKDIGPIKTVTKSTSIGFTTTITNELLSYVIK